MPFPINIRNLGGVAQMLTSLRNDLYAAPPTTIAGVSPSNWPTANQPIRPIGPPGSQPLAFPYWFGQNQQYTPRPDATYSAGDLRLLSMYPLARICISNTKDTIGQISWSIQLRQMPGETESDVKARRRSRKRKDTAIVSLSKFFERPSREHNWQEWTRMVLENMLVIDAASTLINRNRKGSIAELYPLIDGASISRYVDDQGYTPQPPSPAYLQNYQGMPRVQLTTDQLYYRPRNIVPRSGMVSSFLFGCSPSEELADEIKVGIARLMYTMAYYKDGSVGNMIHVVPPKVTPDRMREAMQFYNSEMSGNFADRRQYRIIQGFQDDGKPDQVVFPKEPTLADQYDDLHLRRICFGYGTSPTRLQKMLNRGASQVSQTASQQEGIRPWMIWLKGFVDYLIQVTLGYEEYELEFDPYFESDYFKRARADSQYVHEGVLTRREVREDLGRDPTENPYENELTVTTANGIVKLGEFIVSGKGGGDGMPQDGPKPVSGNTAKPTPAAKVNGHAAVVERGEGMSIRDLSQEVAEILKV